MKTTRFSGRSKLARTIKYRRASVTAFSVGLQKALAATSVGIITAIMSDCHFPIQKEEKISSKISFEVAAPVTSSNIPAASSSLMPRRS